MFLKSGKFDMLDLVRSRTFNNNKPFYSKKSGIFKSLHNFVAKKTYLKITSQQTMSFLTAIGLKLFDIL